jgi:UDP-N-acetylmuramyl pentapeptide synthase
VRATEAVDAASLAVKHVRAGDVVLVKASRSVGAERVVEALAQARGGELEVPSPPSERR